MMAIRQCLTALVCFSSALSFTPSWTEALVNLRLNLRRDP